MPPFLFLKCQIFRLSKPCPALRVTHCFLACKAFLMALGGKQAGFSLCIFTDEGNDLFKVTLEPRAAWTPAPLCLLGGFVTLGMVLSSLALSPI